MARVNTKIGDVFSVNLGDGSKKYFQYIVSDLTLLNSDVIRVFKNIYPINAAPDLVEVVKDEIEFYAHCVTKLGINLGYWEKVGNTKGVGETGHILFRGTNDYGHKRGEEPFKVSTNWYIWFVNDENFKQVGVLEGENKKAEIGVVINPASIVCRIKTGKYDFVYPEY